MRHEPETTHARENVTRPPEPLLARPLDQSNHAYDPSSYRSLAV